MDSQIIIGIAISVVVILLILGVLASASTSSKGVKAGSSFNGKKACIPCGQKAPSCQAGGQNADISMLLGMLSLVNNTLGGEDEKQEQSGGTQGQVVLFYAPWCGHCQNLKPVWNRLESEFKGQVVKVNGDEEPKLVSKFGVDGFPTIYYCPNGKNSNKDAVLYEGDRSEADLLKFIKSRLK